MPSATRGLALFRSASAAPQAGPSSSARAQTWKKHSLPTHAPSASTSSRRPYSTSSSSSSSPSSSSTRNADELHSLQRGARRNARQGRVTEVDPYNVDIVGPPDPISNIRPVIYAQSEISDSKRRREGPAPGQAGASASAFGPQQQQPHPYSAHEFSQPSSSTEGSRRLRGLGIFRYYRDHVDSVTDRFEEASMRLRLAKLGTDATTQRFWRDNNIRFSRDLESWRRRKGLIEGAETESANRPVQNRQAQAQDTSQSAVTSDTASLPLSPLEPSSESDFYATWLQANSRRNRAYNILVWKQAWEQVRLSARVSALRTWLRVARRLEGR